MREIGVVKQVQIQRESLKRVDGTQQAFDPTPLLIVDRLRLSSDGVLGFLADGTQIIDVHNVHHPGSRNRGDNWVSVNFISHYAAMQKQFGAHLTEGIAGENILVESSDAVLTVADFGKRLAFKSNETSEMVYLTDIIPAPPCEPFSRFALCQSPPVPAAVMKSTLQFLGDGMRGFYAAAVSGTIQAGNVVFAVDD